jgi:hypothetical protein
MCSGEILYLMLVRIQGRTDGVSYHFLTPVEINTLHG